MAARRWLLTGAAAALVAVVAVASTTAARAASPQPHALLQLALVRERDAFVDEEGESSSTSAPSRRAHNAHPRFPRNHTARVLLMAGAVRARMARWNVNPAARSRPKNLPTPPTPTRTPMARADHSPPPQPNRTPKTKKQTSPDQAYDAWRAAHGKPAPQTPSERSARLSAFHQNAAFIAAHNRRAQAEAVQQQNGDSSTTVEPMRLELNAYADITWDEFKRTRLGYRPRGADNNNKNAANALSSPPPSARIPGFSHAHRTPPPKIDWRDQGAVSPVGNQGACGSCYAWSAVGAIEGANALATGVTPPEALSVQEVVDCDRGFSEDSGCGGGLMDNVFEFVAANGGLDTADEYGYYSSWGLPLSWCNKRKMADRRVVSIDGYEDVPVDDEDALLKAASAQPVSVAICASSALQFYGGGVVAEKACCEELNHGVLLVGYDEESWLIKNSWGAEWGESGYFRLKRVSAGGKKATAAETPATTPAPTKGLCGITDASSYPVKKTAENPRVPSSCDMFAWAECPFAQTCGCNWRLPLFGGIFPLCLKHDCCPHPRGVDSCGDGAHCCPGDRPVCDPGRGVCVRDAAQARLRNGDEGAVPWLSKVPANYSWGWNEQEAVAMAARAMMRGAREAVAPETAAAVAAS
jgi:hypothetical protein